MIGSSARLISDTGHLQTPPPTVLFVTLTLLTIIETEPITKRWMQLLIRLSGKHERSIVVILIERATATSDAAG